MSFHLGAKLVEGGGGVKTRNFGIVKDVTAVRKTCSREVVGRELHITHCIARESMRYNLETANTGADKTLNCQNGATQVQIGLPPLLNWPESALLYLSREGAEEMNHWHLIPRPVRRRIK